MQVLFKKNKESILYDGMTVHKTLKSTLIPQLNSLFLDELFQI